MNNDGLTPALRDILDDIDHDPGIVLTGPRLALGNKLRAKGLVETFVRPVDADHAEEVRGFRTTDPGRVLLGRCITAETKAKLEAEVKMVLHAHRDCFRNRGRDT